MEPRNLSRENFKSYAPAAQRVAVGHLDLFRDLPIVLAAAMLREIVDYDSRFPRERATIDAHLAFLASLTPPERHKLTKQFADLAISPELAAQDWVSYPQKFEESLSAHLWASKQQDAFRAAAVSFGDAMAKAAPPWQPTMPRWTVVVIGPELRKDGYALFRKLRPHGTFYPNVDGTGGMDAIMNRVSERTAGSQSPYDHWYVDGGTAENGLPAGVSQFSWESSAPLRAEILKKVQSVIGSRSGGPEMLRSIMGSWALESRSAQSNDPLVDQFLMSVYGDGSGTQIFSTTFVQWSARELLRRAEPLSLVARFGARQRQRTMNEMFTDTSSQPAPDFPGSLVDADFAAYYTWINLNRLNNPQPATFIAWSAAHGQAIAIGPGWPKSVQAPDRTTIAQLLQA